MVAGVGDSSRAANAYRWALAAETNTHMSENSSRRTPVRLVVLLVLHAACGVFILWLLLRLVPQYVKIFKDFNTKLPEMTIMVIDLSTLCGRWWFPLVPCLGAADIAVMVSLNRTGRTGLMTACGVLAWLAEMLLIGAILLVVFVPINALITNLSGGK